MKTKLDKCFTQVNDSFNKRLDAAFAKKFPGITIQTMFNIFTMQKVSTRVDGKKFTKEQHAFVMGFSEGYADAMYQITEQS